MSNSDSYPKPNSSVPGGVRQPRRSAGERPVPSRSSARAAPAGLRRPSGRRRRASVPRRASPRHRASARPHRASGRPAPGQRPAQGGPGLVKPAPKAKVRRARLLVSKVDPWSVLKMAFLLSVALGIVTVVAAIVLWTVLDLTGIFDQVDGLLGTLAGSEGGGFELKKVASLGQVASFATIIAVVNVVLLTALSMLSAVLYNISATLVGGIGVTLTDD